MNIYQFAHNLKIRWKLAGAFVLMSTLITVLGGVSIYNFKNLQNDADVFSKNIVPSLRLANDMRNEAAAIRRFEAQMITANADEAINLQKRSKAQIESVRKQLKELEAYAVAPDEKELLNATVIAVEGYFSSHEKFSGMFGQGDLVGAKAYMFGEQRNLFTKMIEDLDKFNKIQFDEANNTAAESATIVQKATIEAIVLLGLGVTASTILGILLAKLISRPLARAREVAAEIAKGNLTNDIVVTRKDEPGEMLESFKAMQHSLVQMVSQVRQSASSIETACTEIAAGNSDLSARTESQAAALEQTAASMDELNSTVRSNTQIAVSVDEKAGHAKELAASGAQIVRSTVEAIHAIEASSQKIGEIVNVISGIAFQTNILALNAAVEAARAGEQGKGFAVVASEVRTLAARSSDAARQIKELVAVSNENVEKGVERANKAGKAIETMEAAAAEVAMLVSSISSASEQQSLGVSHVSEAIASLDSVTQQNAALVEETAAAAESLKRQAEELVHLVASFKTN